MQTTITITFGDVAENHVGNQQIGQKAVDGFNLADLVAIQQQFESRSFECELINLNSYLPDDIAAAAEDAFILVIRNGVAAFCDPQVL